MLKLNQIIAVPFQNGSICMDKIADFFGNAKAHVKYIAQQTHENCYDVMHTIYGVQHLCKLQCLESCALCA